MDFQPVTDSDKEMVLNRLKDYLRIQGCPIPDDQTLEEIYKESISLINQVNNSGRISLVNQERKSSIVAFHRQFTENNMGVFTPPEVMRTNNKKLVFPLLREAIDGDSEAKQFYEKERLLTFGEFSDPAKKYITTQLRLYVQSKKLTTRSWIEPKHRRHMKKDFLNEPIRFIEGKEISLGLASILSYESANDVLSATKKGDYDQYLHLQTNPFNSRIKIMGAILNPYGTGPGGLLARDLFEKGVELMLKIQILEDYLEITGFDLTWDIKRQILSTYKEPWGLSESKAVQNLGYLAEQLDLNLIDPARIENILKNFRQLNSYNLSGIIAKSNGANQKTKQYSQEQNAARPKSVIFYTKSEFIEGLLSSLQQISDQDRNCGKKLYALYTRGIVSYEEAVDLIGKVGNDHTAVDSYITDALSLRRERYTIDVDDPKDNTHDKAIQETASNKEERIEISGLDQRWYKNWLESLSPADRDIVARRFERVNRGLFGRSEQLRADRRVFELKISAEKEIRIYFFYNNANEITLLQAGVKSTQSKDIEQAIKLLKSV